jgi:hypothetical protein
MITIYTGVFGKQIRVLGSSRTVNFAGYIIEGDRVIKDFSELTLFPQPEQAEREAYWEALKIATLLYPSEDIAVFHYNERTPHTEYLQKKCKGLESVFPSIDIKVLRRGKNPAITLCRDGADSIYNLDTTAGAPSPADLRWISKRPKPTWFVCDMIYRQLVLPPPARCCRIRKFDGSETCG